MGASAKAQMGRYTERAIKTYCLGEQSSGVLFITGHLKGFGMKLLYGQTAFAEKQKSFGGRNTFRFLCVSLPWLETHIGLVGETSMV